MEASSPTDVQGRLAVRPLWRAGLILRLHLHFILFVVSCANKNALLLSLFLFANIKHVSLSVTHN